MLMYFIETRQVGSEQESAKYGNATKKGRTSNKIAATLKYRLDASNKLLKQQVSEIPPTEFYENSWRLRVYNIRAKFSCHCRGISKTSWANGLKNTQVRPHFRAKQTNKSTFSLCPKEYR